MRNSVVFAAWCAVYDVPSPQDSTVDCARPLLTARFSGPVASNTCRLLIDGVDVTQETREQGGVLSYTPATDLSEGRHTVQVQASDAHGRPLGREWSFHVRPMARTASQGVVAALDLSVTNLAEAGSAVFQVRGRTDPLAQVHASGRSSSALSRGAVTLHDATLNARADADANGAFTLQLTAPSLPVDYIITLRVTAADRKSSWGS